MREELGSAAAALLLTGDRTDAGRFSRSCISQSVLFARL